MWSASVNQNERNTLFSIVDQQESVVVSKLVWLSGFVFSDLSRSSGNEIQLWGAIAQYLLRVRPVPRILSVAIIVQPKTTGMALENRDPWPLKLIAIRRSLGADHLRDGRGLCKYWLTPAPETSPQPGHVRCDPFRVKRSINQNQ